MLTLDGRCKTLDAAADGYVRADAVIVLRLDATTDSGPPTRSIVIRGTFVNQDGRSSSLTAPNGPSQQAVIRGALLAAGADQGDVGTLEMHGTGTPLGAQTLREHWNDLPWHPCNVQHSSNVMPGDLCGQHCLSADL